MNAPKLREDAPKHRYNGVWPVLGHCGCYEGLSLTRIQDRGVNGRLRQQVRQQFRKLARRQVGVVKRWMLADGKNGVLEIRANDVRCLHGKFPARLASNNRGREHELFEWL